MASPVQHIVRWSPQDWLTSRVRTRSIVTGRPMLRLVYFEILQALYEAGGAISADPEDLQDKIALPLPDIEECLPVLLDIGKRGRGGLRVEHLDGKPVLVNGRASEEIAEEIAYRATQQEHGKKGGRPRKATVTDEQKQGENGKATLQNQKGTLSEKKGTPIPPTPLPSPTPTPSPSKRAPSELVPRPSVAEPGASPVVMVFPVRGDKEKTGWGLTEAKRAEYRESFPGLDIDGELLKARQWCRDHENERKTARGMPAFLGRWLDKAANSGWGRKTNGHDAAPSPKNPDRLSQSRALARFEQLKAEIEARADLDADEKRRRQNLVLDIAGGPDATEAHLRAAAEKGLAPPGHVHTLLTQPPRPREVHHGVA